MCVSLIAGPKVCGKVHLCFHGSGATGCPALRDTSRGFGIEFRGPG